MQGIYINGRRPKSKKEIKEALARNPEVVAAEATSVFGNEFDGTVAALPVGRSIMFVGPCPYTNRKFYGKIAHTVKGGIKVVM